MGPQDVGGDNDEVQAMANPWPQLKMTWEEWQLKQTAGPHVLTSALPREPQSQVREDGPTETRVPPPSSDLGSDVESSNGPSIQSSEENPRRDGSCLEKLGTFSQEKSKTRTLLAADQLLNPEKEALLTRPLTHQAWLEEQKSSPNMKAILKPESININAAPVKADLSDDWKRVNNLIG